MHVKARRRTGGMTAFVPMLGSVPLVVQGQTSACRVKLVQQQGMVKKGLKIEW